MPEFVSNSADDERRREIWANPPDILLTNYVMLELILTRPDEGKLVKSMRGLQFLVFDELHTYRGRQGSDVAMLISFADIARVDTATAQEGVRAQRLRRHYQRAMRALFHDIDILLTQNRIHGDLSAYNILYWKGGITLIDFPQVIDPETNHNAYRIFERDVTRICEYFIRQGVPSDPRRLAAKLWTAFRYPLRQEIHPSLLDGEDEKDRAYWRNRKV